jgi:hypothetical protein
MPNQPSTIETNAAVLPAPGPTGKENLKLPISDEQLGHEIVKIVGNHHPFKIDLRPPFDAQAMSLIGAEIRELIGHVPAAPGGDDTTVSDDVREITKILEDGESDAFAKIALFFRCRENSLQGRLNDALKTTERWFTAYNMTHKQAGKEINRLNRNRVEIISAFRRMCDELERS